MPDDTCIFCEILAGRAPASFVFRDESCSAFLDINPVNPGHCLVVPNRHATSLAELDAEDGAVMFRMAQRVAAALRGSGLRCEGVNLYLADGEAAGQDVFHVHLHVLPRFRGDSFGLTFGHDYPSSPARTELDDIARRLREGSAVIDKIAWIHLEDGAILGTRSRGKDKYYLPGGKREPGEADLDTLVREISEELSVTIDEQSARKLGVFEAQAHGHPEGTLIRMTCYTAAHAGRIVASSEIEEIAWLGYGDRQRVSPVDQVIFDHLHDAGLLR